MPIRENKIMTKHTPTLSYSDGSLWGISPLNARVRLADMRKHSPMNGIDQEANAAFIVRACNAHEGLVEALEYLLASEHHPGVAREMAIKALAKAKQ